MLLYELFRAVFDYNTPILIKIVLISFASDRAEGFARDTFFSFDRQNYLFGSGDFGFGTRSPYGRFS
jgi:hypothetical protein